MVLDSECYCLDVLDNVAEDAQCSTVCAGYSTATCGSATHMSVYRTTAFQYSIGAEVPIQGFSVQLMGSDTFTIIDRQTAEIIFNITQGTNVNHFIYGTNALEYVQTTLTTVYLVFPAPGVYDLTAVALNAANRIEQPFSITVIDDIKAITHLSITGGVSETNITSTIAIHMVDGLDVNCNVSFGDDSEQTYNNVEDLDSIEHTYLSADVFNVTMACASGYRHDTASTLMVVLEGLSVNMAPSLMLALGDDLVVDFSLGGSNITDVSVTFDTRALEVTCEVVWDCQATVTSDMYNEEAGTHVFAVAVNSAFNSINEFMDIIVGKPVKGLSVSVSKSHVLVNEDLLLSVYVSEGSQVYITLSIEDFKQIYVCTEAPCSYAITTILPDGGYYIAMLEAANDFTIEAENVTFIVYQPIPSLVISANNVTTLAEEVSIRINIVDGQPWPNDATVSIVVADHVEEAPFEPNEEGVFIHEWIPQDYDVYTVKANVSNALQYILLNGTFQVGEAIEGLFIDVAKQVLIVDTDTEIVVGFTTGNPISLIVHFGDGKNETDEYTREKMLTNKTNATHIYEDDGEFIINVTASNFLGTTTTSKVITVFRPIEGLYLGINVSVISVGEPVEVLIGMEESAVIPLNTSCLFNFGDGTESQKLPLKITPTSELLLTHTYADAHGNVSITAVCSNRISAAEMSAELTVILPVINCTVFGPLVVATGDLAEFQIDLQGSHLQMDVYVENGTTIREQWVRLDGDAKTFTFNKTYDQPGVYSIDVSASNQLGLCKSNTTVTILNSVIEGSFSLTITPPIVALSDPTVSIAVRLLKQFVMPSEVQVHIDFGDGFTISNTYLNVFAENGTVKHKYTGIGIFRITVLLQNQLSQMELSDEAIVMEIVRNLQIIPSTYAIEMDNEITFDMSTASGSNLTYHVSYGDGSNETTIPPLARIVTFTHQYADVGLYRVNFSASNQLGVIHDSVEINILVPIEGLSLRAEPDIINIPGTMKFILSQEPGYSLPTEMNCTTNLRDGSEVSTMKAVDLSTEVTMVNKLYLAGGGAGGEYHAYVLCENLLGVGDATASFKIYEPVSAITIETSTGIAEVKGDVNFTVSLTTGSFVSFVIDFGDSATESRHITFSRDTKHQEFIHSYQDEGHYQITVTASNGILSTNGLEMETATCNLTVSYKADMFHLLVESSDDFLAPGNIQYILAVLPQQEPPKKVSLIWTFEDGKTAQSVWYLDATERFMIEHEYDDPGVYITTVSVKTLAQSHNYTTTVTMIDPTPPLIVALKYTNNSEDIWYDGHGPDNNWIPVRHPIKFTANTTFQDALITWSFGDDTADETSETVYHEYSTADWYNVTVTIRYATHTLIEEYFDLFVVGEFVSIAISAESTVESELGDVWIQTESVLSLQSVESTGPFCVAWTVTDSSQIDIYGPPPCAEHVTSAGIIFTESDINSPAPYEHRHTFVNPGHYKVIAAIENYVSLTNVTINTVVTVKGCSGPIQVAFTGIGQAVESPRDHLSSDVISLDPSVSFPCVGVENPEFDWKCNSLRKLTDGTILGTPVDIEPSTRAKRVFESLTFKPGLYEMKLTVTVPGFPNYSGTDSIFFEIEPSPLVLNIIGGSTRSVGTGETLILNAVSLSKDPDDPESNPMSWLFTWSCFSIPTSYTDFTTVEPDMAEIADVRDEIPRVCDSEIAETLEFTGGQMEIDGMMLKVGNMYQFTVTASVNGKTQKVEQEVLAEKGIIPSVLIR